MSQSTHTLFDGLQRRYTDDASISLSLSDGDEPVIQLRMHEHGDLPIQVIASGEQILVSTALVGAERIRDRAAFDRACMLLNPVNPLSNLGLVINPDHSETYVVFGELSANSDLDAIDEEIRTLAVNTLEAAESFRDYFN